jgi:ABC-type multidrug transport system ATPase subunit
LFGQPYDAEKFHQVITACAMNHDLELLPYREHTVVGSRGINLSGGQKARLALARCLYADTCLCLLDDPLSAVDAKVSNMLFHQAICGYLANKTRILVTHQIQFLSSPHVSRIVVIAKGAIVFCGKFNELQHSEYSSEFTEGVFGGESSNSNNNVNNDNTSENTANTRPTATNSFDRPTSDSSSDNPDASTSTAEQSQQQQKHSIVSLVTDNDNIDNDGHVEMNATKNSNINAMPDSNSGSGSKTTSNIKNHSTRGNFMFASGLKNASMKFDFSGRSNRNKNSFYNSICSNDNRTEMNGDVAVSEGVVETEVVVDDSVLINDTTANGDKSSIEKEQQAEAVVQGNVFKL